MIDPLLDAEELLCDLQRRLEECAERSADPVLSASLHHCIRDVVLVKRAIAGELVARQELAAA